MRPFNEARIRELECVIAEVEHRIHRITTEDMGDIPEAVIQTERRRLEQRKRGYEEEIRRLEKD